MRKSVVVLFVILLAFPMLWAGQTAEKKLASRKSSSAAAKSATPSATSGEQPSKRAYVELAISELVSEDANRWTDKMSTHAAVGGFVTQVIKRDDGDTDIRICESPKAVAWTGRTASCLSAYRRFHARYLKSESRSPLRGSPDMKPKWELTGGRLIRWSR